LEHVRLTNRGIEIAVFSEALHWLVRHSCTVFHYYVYRRED